MASTPDKSVAATIRLAAEALLVGGAENRRGAVLATTTPLSLWGGIDPASGDITDRHHPLSGANWDGKAVVIPHGRGSCTGSVVLLEAIHAGHAPAMILLKKADTIIGLGAIVADEMLQQAVPVAVLDDTVFAAARQACAANLGPDGTLTLYGDETLEALPARARPATALPPALELSAADTSRLNGNAGPAAQVAMRIIQRMARLQGADRLVDVTRAHIDACIYTGPAGLAFARQLAEWRGRVAVPTTLNAISIDRRQWRELGVPEARAQPAGDLADAYARLGAMPTYTCAPYLLDGEPEPGECIAWAESNAVVFANSVLGARTDKTPDLLDACIALTGRAPLAGCYLDANRRARVVVELPPIRQADDALWPLLGHVVGTHADRRVPVITNVPHEPDRDELKAFGAAFATTSSAGMFHIAGVTPEAETVDMALAGHDPESHIRLTLDDLRSAWRTFNGAADRTVDLVALGNPHFSRAEFAAMAALCSGRHKHDGVDVVVTTNRTVADQAERARHLAVLRAFGARVVTDTCWCMLQEPIIEPDTHVIVTNSGKYAHYGPGLINQQVCFASLAGCIEAAVTGSVRADLPPWLVDDPNAP